MNELTILEFVAQLVNREKAIAGGYAGPTLWLCTNVDHQRICLKEATLLFESWKREELDAQKGREELRAAIKVLPVGG